MSVMSGTHPVLTFPRAHRQELPYRCSRCGADRGCDCNAPAIEKIAKARAADPAGSTRAIARAAGVSQSSAQRAMKSTEPNGSVRVGLDGKARRMPKATATRWGREHSGRRGARAALKSQKNSSGKPAKGAAARALRDGLQAEFASRPKDANGMEPMGSTRDLILERLVNDLGPAVVTPKGSKLSDDFLREVFEEFLLRRRKALRNLYGERLRDD